jgi:F0F1-type ATP synthase membrane subunit c/vacuolar-type H+-ATPase subunit K
MQNQKLNVEAQYRVLTVVWIALLFSQLLLLVVLFFARPEVFRFDLSKSLLGGNPVVIVMFALLAISNLVLSFVLSRKYLNQAIAGQKPALVQTAMIIGCALCEAISLFGVALAFAFSYQYFFLWFALGILGTILHFPKRDNLIVAAYKGWKSVE